MENKRTCLYDKHVALGALISPFGGFDMPIQYSNIVDEHNAVRQACGVFDVSHMGEVLVTGPESEAFVNYIFTNDISASNSKFLTKSATKIKLPFRTANIRRFSSFSSLVGQR